MKPFPVLLLLLLSGACGRDPELKFEPEASEIRSIASLKQLYEGYPKPIAQELYIEGMVISSDRGGNLRRSLMIQDATGGIEIRAAMDRLYRVYERGTRLLVRCNTLTLSDYGGSVQLGYGSDPIPEDQLNAHLRIMDATPHLPDPQLLTIQGFAGRWVNCRVRIEGLQVVEQERGLTWGETDRDVDRHLVDIHRDTLVVRVNAGSDLAAMPMPRGSGAIEGILTYFNGYQLRPLSVADIDMR